MDRRTFLTLTTGVVGAVITGTARSVGAQTADGRRFAPENRPRNLSANAQAVLRYIHDNFGKRTITGQHGGAHRVDYVTRTTGKTPAIWGTDLIRRKDDAKTLAFVKDAWRAGAIPTVMWHWGAPTLGDGFEQSKTKIDIAKCFQKGTAESGAMWVDLKSRADVLTELRDAKIPILWRPLHENSGGWFWWDKGGPELFVKLWRTMYDYFTHERKLDNLIWVNGMCGNPKPAFDPGVDYYDIIGGDQYSGQQPWPKLYRAVEKIAPKGIPITLHECGGPPDPDDALKQKTLWSWFMIWDTHVEKVDPARLKSVYHNALSVTLDGLPDWKQRTEAGR